MRILIKLYSYLETKSLVKNIWYRIICLSFVMCVRKKLGSSRDTKFLRVRLSIRQIFTKEGSETKMAEIRRITSFR